MILASIKTFARELGFIKMKKLYISSALGIMLALNSCTVVAGIFKAGAVVGVIAVVIVIAVIIWIISLFRGRN